MKRPLVLLASLASFSLYAQDARIQAMGGAGTANADYLAAPFYNPALLSHFDESDDFGLELPSIAASFQDKDSLLDKIDDFQDLNDRLEAVQQNPNGTTQAEAEQLVGQWQDALRKMNGNSLDGEIGLGAAMALPNKTLSSAFFIGVTAYVRGIVDIDENDLDWTAAELPDQDLDNLNSNVKAVGIAVVDTGLAFSHGFTLNNGDLLMVGASPKAQRIYSYFYQADVSNFDDSDWDDSQYRQDKSAFNLDLGLAYQHDNWRLGLSGQNLFKQQVDSIIINQQQFRYQLKPRFTLGGSYENHWFAATLEAELTKTELPSFIGEKQQWVRAGVEFDAYRWAQLRLGYRHDLEEGQNVLTAGVGFSPFDTVHLDFAFETGQNSHTGGALTLGFTF
ncbi:conjugal transfer protein TraF [Gallaecimonas mangrovi]|uniref:conjugal transfer protein TraF n=1 Tax=Gallaecimonas mangrovi TaxID=2291597 RepID=UPI000E203EE6|nr:conjugal transfer protein TraF [Gallaecimonas mangrovi]